MGEPRAARPWQRAAAREPEGGMTSSAEPGTPASRYDVAIVGSHLSTALLAAILARHGVKTILIPTESDRHTPAGETTVPYTAELFFLLGSKFGLPEITKLGMFSTLPESVRCDCGVKRNLSFLYHRPGTRQQPAETLQFNVPAEHAEWHAYRPCVDAHAAGLAAANGAVVLHSDASPGGVTIGPDHIAVRLVDGRDIRARYLVNGSADPQMLPPGVQGPLSTRAKHRARLLFAHLSGVSALESVAPLSRYGKASPWSEGTLLHVFSGGWVQVVPFGNHAGSGNERCSVTVSLDPSQAAPTVAPSTEFRQLIQRFPELNRQFGHTPTAQPWQASPDWPAIATTCTGPRWLLFDRAAGRHDLLLSRDITMSLELVHAAATGLLRMAATGDWAGHQMSEIGEFQLRLFEFHDRFIAAGRTATRSFLLWNAYLRVWLLWSILSALSLKRARLDGSAGSRPASWSSVEQFAEVPYWYRVPTGLPELMLESLREIESVALGTPAETAASHIFAMLRKESFVPPLYRFGDPQARYYNFTRSRRLRMLLWAKTTAPPDFRRLLTAENITASPPGHS